MTQEQPAADSWIKRLAILAVKCLVIPFCLIAFLELIAGISGSTIPTTLFVADTGSDNSACRRVNYQTGYRFFPGRLARKPLAEFFATSKPKDRRRIFVLGESAARGEQLADFSFSRILEAVLNQGQTQKRVEVINTGIPAINSWVLREFAREIINYEPDLLIIYAGHNEFIGPYGPASVFGLAKSRIGIELGIWASSLHLVQWLRSDSPPTRLRQGWKGLEMFLQNKLTLDDPAVKDCQSNWQKNLEEIMNLAKQRQVPVIWCRVPVNHKDCPPFISDDSRLDEETRSAISRICQTAESKTPAELISEIEQIKAKAPHHALLNYLEAQARLASRQNSEAATLFSRAIDNDCFRVRVNKSFNDSASEAISLYNGLTADVEAEFISNSEAGIIGSDLVYDHVHLTESGHYLAARSIFRTMQQFKLLPELLPAAFPDFAQTCALTGLTSNDQIVNFEHILSSLQSPPFTLQFAHSKRIASFSELLQQAKSRNNHSENLRITQEALTRQPYNAALSLRIAMMMIDQPSEAEKFFLHSLSANPFNIDALNNHGLLLMSRGDIAGAEKSFLCALRLAPDFARAHFNLGVIKSAKNDTSSAIRHYQEAVKSDPGLIGAWRNLANLYFKNRQFSEALAVYKMTVEANPGDLPASLGIGNCMVEQQKFDDAAAIYQGLVASFPDSPLPHFSLGLSMVKASKYADAARSFYQSGELGYPDGYRKVIELHLSGQNSLNSQQYMESSEKACQLTNFSDPWFMQIYAAALLESEKKNEALQILHRALDLAIKNNDQTLATEIEANIKALHGR